MGMSDELLEAHGRKHLNEYTHWVYILRCRNRFRSFDQCERKAKKRVGRVPDWLREAFESQRLYYVGQTENLDKRLGQHLKQKNSSEFTTLFPAMAVERLIPENSRGSAEYRESRLAKAWGNDDKSFAYSY